MEELSADVAVVGAGLSGLACARALARAGKRVVVLEARDRVGGRTLSRTLGGARFDLGGQWITPKQRRVSALVKELGLATFRTYHDGEHALVTGGRVVRYRGVIPRMPALALAELGLAVARSYGSSWLLPRDERDGPALAAFDARTAADVARSIREPEGQAAFDAAFRTVFGAEAKDVSLYWFLHYVRSGNGFLHLVDVEGGAQELRLARGAQELSLALAAELGAAVRLSAPLREATQTSDGVILRAEGAEVRARRAVFAIPVPLLRSVRFEPSLPDARAKTIDASVMGSAVKLLALYDRPFWRERGLSGEAVFDRGPISVSFDNASPCEQGPVHQAALVGFVMGDAAKRYAATDPEARRDEALAALASVFGDEARRPTELVEQDWSAEPWSGGCPVASYPPGVLAGRAPSLRQPVGRFHWAGTETAAEYPGYLEGALEAAERATREILSGS